MKIPKFRKKGRPSVLSASDINVIADAVRALVNIRVTTGREPAVFLTDGNLVIQFPTSTATGGTSSDLYHFRFVGPVTLIGVGCHTFDPQTSTEGEDLVYVAFPLDMMPDIIPGRVMPDASKQTYDYTNIASQQRVMTVVDSDPLVTKTQQITPALCAADGTDPTTYPATRITAIKLYPGFFIDDVPVQYIMHGMTIHWGNT